MLRGNSLYIVGQDVTTRYRRVRALLPTGKQPVTGVSDCSSGKAVGKQMDPVHHVKKSMSTLRRRDFVRLVAKPQSTTNPKAARPDITVLEYDCDPVRVYWYFPGEIHFTATGTY